MQFSVRRLAPGELDHELIWLSVSVLSLGLAAGMVNDRVALAAVRFSRPYQLPCVTCGMTRCGIQFFHGHFLAALRWNPFVFVGSLRRHRVRRIRAGNGHRAHAAIAGPSFHATGENLFACLSHLCARAELDVSATALAQFLNHRSRRLIAVFGTDSLQFSSCTGCRPWFNF